jgi:HAD superfamily hydrolase (TIGR01509 family)
LKGIFQNVITADDLGHKKSEPEAYYMLAARLGYTPADIFFVDDQQKNIDAAKQAGCATHLYTGNADIIALLQKAV